MLIISVVPVLWEASPAQHYQQDQQEGGNIMEVSLLFPGSLTFNNWKQGVKKKSGMNSWG